MRPPPSARREELELAARAALILDARRKAHPLAYAKLWDQPEPQTSQRRAFAAGIGAQGLVLVGGNGTGKTWVAALWAILQASGSDDPDVVRFAARNELDLSVIPKGPGIVWVCSETFGAAVEQIRKHLSALAPVGTTTRSWGVEKQASMTLPNGGRIISKAYEQYKARPQTWEGAQIRAVVFDEQPCSEKAMTAAFARTRSLAREATGKPRWFWLLAYTGLQGKDWLYHLHVANPSPTVPVRWIWGEDNPHLDQVQQAALLASYPAWQRAARARGEFTSPVGRRLPIFDRAIHVLGPDQMPELPGSWLRYVGVDPGSRHPHALWLAESPNGDLFGYREYAPRLTTTEPGLPDGDFIATCKALERQDPAPARYRICDSADPGFITTAARAGWPVMPAAKGAGSIEDGLDLIESFLNTTWRGQPRKPRLYLSSACPVTINDLEQLRWLPEQPGKPPATDPACTDEGPDTLRYVLQFRRSLGRS